MSFKVGTVSITRKEHTFIVPSLMADGGESVPPVQPSDNFDLGFTVANMNFDRAISVSRNFH
jgi:hypothetical protein